MNMIKAERIPAEDAEGVPRVSRRRLLGGLGAGGLATVATVFGFASPAAATTVPYGCCHLCCKPRGRTLAQCETGPAFFYVWTCAESNGTTCKCCEHHSPCSHGCNSASFSVGQCT